MQAYQGVVFGRQRGSSDCRAGPAATEPGPGSIPGLAGSDGPWEGDQRTGATQDKDAEIH